MVSCAATDYITLFTPFADRVRFSLRRFLELFHVKLAVLVQVVLFDHLVDLLHAHVLFGQLELAFGDVAVLVFVHCLLINICRALIKTSSVCISKDYHLECILRMNVHA